MKEKSDEAQQFFDLMKSKEIVEKARQIREETSFLYRKDLNTIAKVNVKAMDLLR